MSSGRVTSEADPQGNDNMPRMKMVVVGDGAVGKTCLLVSYTENTFPEGYVPTVFNNVEKVIEFKDSESEEMIKVKADIWDTAGQEEFERIRVLSYRGTQVFLLCFSVVNPVSFKNAKDMWLPEMKFHTKGDSPQIILVGLKSDLREDTGTISKLKDQGMAPVAQKDIDAFVNSERDVKGYVECSALKNINVDTVFESGVNAVLDGGHAEVLGDEPSPKGSCCVIL